MNKISKFALLFYCSTGVISAGAILLLLYALQFPALSEAIIGIALFIHSFILARSAKDLFMSAYEKGLVSEWVFQLQQSYEVSSNNRERDV